MKQETSRGHNFELMVEGLPAAVVSVQGAGVLSFSRESNGDEGDVIRYAGDALEYKEPVGIYKGPEWDIITEGVHEKCNSVWTNHSEDREYFCSHQFDERAFTKGKFDYDDTTYADIVSSKQEEHIRHTATHAMGMCNFTEKGFEESDIPEDFLAELQEFYRNERTSSSHPESMDVFDSALSGRNSDTWLANLPDEIKRKVYSYVRSEISKWTSVPEEDLIETSVFGIRLYHRGSVLNLHCDHKRTHILSAILQIGRANAEDTEPWDLTILDHSGVEHRVPARAGQLILYESASCAHGRIEPFAGLEMANAFCHFHPAGWPEKYRSSGIDGICTTTASDHDGVGFLDKEL